MNPLFGKVFSGRLHVFAGDSQTGALPDGLFVIKIFFDCDGKPASRDLQINRLIQPGTAVFLKDIFAGDTEIGCSLLDICRYICGANNDPAALRLVRRKNQFTGCFRIFQNSNAGCFQKWHGFFENPPFGQGKDQFL